MMGCVRSRGQGGAVLALLGVLLAGCSGDLLGTSRPTAAPAPATTMSSPSVSDRMSNFFFGPPARPGDPGTVAAGADVDCPGVAIRQGASTLVVGDAREPNPAPAAIRYQATIAQTARECAALGGVMTMKVGVQGRVIVGPAGGPGQVDVPLRYAVVREGSPPQTIVTKFHRLAVAVPPSQLNAPFLHVDEDLTFPLPRPADLDNYVVYVGFDPAGAPARPEPRRTKARK
jgi:hypothetical protein